MTKTKEGIKKMKVSELDTSKYYYIVPAPLHCNGEPGYHISRPKELFKNVQRIEFDQGLMKWVADVGDALTLEMIVREIGGYRHSYCEDGYVHLVGWE